MHDQLDQLKAEAARLEERIKNLERDARKLPPDLERAHAKVHALNRDNKRQQAEIERLTVALDARPTEEDISQLGEEIERLRAEVKKLRELIALDEKNYLLTKRETFLDAARMAEEWAAAHGTAVQKAFAAFAIVLRRAAEGVKDAD